MDAGTQVDDHCITEFNHLKLGKQYRYIVFVIEQSTQTIKVEKLGQRDETYEQFVASLPKDQARYAIYDYHYKTHDQPPRNVEKLVFFFWSPDNQAVKLKMTYASGKEALKKKLPGLQKEVQANGYDELDYESVLKEIQ